MELLVTIAIIAILAAILMSALSKSKEAGRKISCVDNHKQLVLAWRMYANDNDDRLVWNVDDGDNQPFTNWVAGHLRNPSDATDTNLLVNPKRSLLASYIKSPKIYKCPTDPSGFVRSVSMNNRLNPVRFVKPPLVLGGYGTNFIIYRRMGSIHATSQIFVTLDERYDSINEGMFAVEMSNTGTFDGEGTPSPYWWLDTPASYHNQSVNLSFADGHVESHRWLESTTLGPIGVTGFRHTSATDRDISWLQERTAERIHQ